MEVKLAKNAYPNKYVYSDYGIGFDLRSKVSLPVGSMGNNVIIFGVGMSSSMHINNKGKHILIFGGINPIQGLDDTTLAADGQYSINFSRSNRKFCLSLHYKGRNSFSFVNATKIYQFKVKDSEIKKYPLHLGNISGDYSANNLKKTGLNGCVYDFSAGYIAFDTSNIIDIRKYLMKKHDTK